MGKCVFNAKYEKYDRWVKRDDKSIYNASCTVCVKTFTLGTMGIWALDSHMQSGKHRENMDRLSVSKRVNTMNNYVTSNKSTEVTKPSALAPILTDTVPDIRRTFGSNDTMKAEIVWTLH